jgi:hypothetical protein
MQSLEFFFLKVVQTGVVDYGGSFLERTVDAGSWTFSGRMMQGNLGRILIRKIYETREQIADSGDVAARRSESISRV